jgi:Glyoxalase/Bleomycin resistance protein/Dioxygenase superfamily
MTLAAEDAGGTFADLREAGVRFEQEPETTAWGTQAIIADPDGQHVRDRGGLNLRRNHSAGWHVVTDAETGGLLVSQIAEI